MKEMFVFLLNRSLTTSYLILAVLVFYACCSENCRRHPSASCGRWWPCGWCCPSLRKVP